MSHVFIGLPIFNGAEYLEDILECVLSQTHHDFTLLIADNASTDETGAISQRFADQDARIQYHRHNQNLGAAPNFNFCLEQASGDYFKWLPHDDLLKPSYLEACIRCLDSDPGAVLCQSHVLRMTSNGQIGEPYLKELDFNDPDPVVRFARAMALDHGCVSVFGVIRMDVLKQTPAIAPFVGSDRPLLAELALHGRLENAPDALYLWRDHKNRSVRMQRRDRIAWFDANAKGVFAGLYLRQLWANQRAAFRAPIPSADRLRAFAKTLTWTMTYRYQMYKDMRAIGGSILEYGKLRN
ncbi:MAG: glycosyltransferase family A protein [Sulfitobacter sp.]